MDLGEQAAAAVAAAAVANQEVDDARARLKTLSATSVAAGGEPVATRRVGHDKSDFKAAAYLVSQRATVAEAAKRKASPNPNPSPNSSPNPNPPRPAGGRGGPGAALHATAAAGPRSL